MPRVDISELPDLEEPSGGRWMVGPVKLGKSDYWFELLDSGVARVRKSPDALTPATYEIQDGICSCPAALHSKVCKHVKTVQHLAAG